MDRCVLYTLTYLWCNFAEYHNQQCGRDNGNQSRCQAVQQNGEGGVDQHIAEQNAAEQKVAVVAYRLNLFRVVLLPQITRIA